jgi:hypothetical protein
MKAKKHVEVRLPETVRYRITLQSFLNEVAEYGPVKVREIDDTNGHRDQEFIAIYRLVQVRRRKRNQGRRNRR